jgi:hypothetical protein
MGWGWGVAGDLKREINKKRKEKQPLDLSKFKNLTNERERKRLEGRIRVIDTRFSESTYT